MYKTPTDQGKMGPKHRVLTDGRSVPLDLAVDGAHRNAFTMVYETM
jgi:hypothetical protein